MRRLQNRQNECLLSRQTGFYASCERKQVICVCNTHHALILIVLKLSALARYYACDSDYVVKIPESIPWEVAGCIQPLAVAMQVICLFILAPLVYAEVSSS